ncbi:hypothetical protein KUCAC02_020798 [Chaenocephalus aceratus]|uniref:Uncharacterized protein n=1 Tax=Chaenocephalus aceratus TaxID=36190 RepID=A0ACB9XEI9_CHAAC|nr:hypothetical protein KUCAC02_020798 [Chaenocephalus aceratus]
MGTMTCICHYCGKLASSSGPPILASFGFSRQAFAKLLEHRTKCGGRSAPVSGEALQRSFLEFSYASYEDEQLCCGATFICPACTPEMLAVPADGNRKLYRFRRSGSSDGSAFWNGLFVAEDSAVAAFVDKIQRSLKKPREEAQVGTPSGQQRGRPRRASKLDGEGMEVAELLPAKAKFFAMDVACKYWPYMGKAANDVEWEEPGGSGVTAGEEVEQVSSYLSRCALTTTYMSEAARLDMLTVHAMGWNR